MARFMGSVQGHKGPAKRAGTKASGMQSHVRGWNIGIRVACSVNDSGQDVMTVWLTSGSHATRGDVLIGQYVDSGADGNGDVNAAEVSAPNHAVVGGTDNVGAGARPITRRGSDNGGG